MRLTYIAFILSSALILPSCGNNDDSPPENLVQYGNPDFEISEFSYIPDPDVYEGSLIIVSVFVRNFGENYKGKCLPGCIANVENAPYRFIGVEMSPQDEYIWMNGESRHYEISAIAGSSGGTNLIVQIDMEKLSGDIDFSNNIRILPITVKKYPAN